MILETVEREFLPHAIQHLADFLDDMGDAKESYLERFSDDIADIHHHAFNTDYYIIGNYRAKQFLGEYAFDVIEYIKDYEQINIGHVSTDFSQPESVVNMLMYILGEIAVNQYFDELESEVA
jgi:hypothetical protein